MNAELPARSNNNESCYIGRLLVSIAPLVLGGLDHGDDILARGSEFEVVDAVGRAKKQLIHRLPPAFVLQILKDFNAGALDAPSAANRLGVSRTRLYQLRTDYLKNKSNYQPKASGGARREAWPPEQEFPACAKSS